MPLRVTIAYDGSDGSASAVAATALLFPGATATVVTVPDPPPSAPATLPRSAPGLSSESVARVFAELSSEIAERARSTAGAGAQAAVAAGLEASPAVVPASPAWAGLLEAAKGSDVLACGSRGRGGLARALLGSTSTSLLHHGKSPTLLVPGVPIGEGPAVIAYDGSEAAAHAISVAGELLGDRPAVIVHVWESPYRHTRSGRALAGAPLEELRDVVDGLDATLAQAAAEVTDAGVELARFAGLDARGETVDSGDGVWRAVSATAATLGAAVIVSGARGLGGARSALLGSVSSGLVHNAERPVLVVPSPSMT